VRDDDLYDRGERAYVAAVAEMAGVHLAPPPELDALPEHTLQAMPEPVRAEARHGG
jgi:hypothetical protein